MLRFLFDQCLPAQIMSGVLSWNAVNPNFHVDVVCVGEPLDLPLGTLDPDVLIWAEAENRLVVTIDYNTMPSHLADHLSAGRHSPGMLLPRPERSIPEIVYELATIAHAADPAEFEDQARYIPL